MPKRPLNSEKLADHYDGMYPTEGNNPLSGSVKDWWEGTQGNI